MSRALVIATGGGIGDVLLATPVMRALRGRYAEIVALTRSAHRDVLARNPDVADVWTDDGIEFPVQARRVREHGFDAAVVTWATLRSAALPFVGRVPERVGQARRLYSQLFTRRVAVKSERGDRTTHWTQVLLDFARALECDVADARPVFVVGEAARASLLAALHHAGVGERYIVLHPTRGVARLRERWPTARLSELGRGLALATDSALVVSGAAGDADVCARIAHEAGGISFAGKTSLAEFGALAEGALAVVAMDSGPMHLAAAVGAPTVGIFALRTDEPLRWAPLGPRTAVVAPAYPCPPGERKETCPDFACIANLDVASVLRALEAVLGTPRG